MPETLRAREENPAAINTLIPEPRRPKIWGHKGEWPSRIISHCLCASALPPTCSTVIPDFSSVYACLPHWTVAEPKASACSSLSSHPPVAVYNNSSHVLSTYYVPGTVPGTWERRGQGSLELSKLRFLLPETRPAGGQGLGGPPPGEVEGLGYRRWRPLGMRRLGNVWGS